MALPLPVCVCNAHRLSKHLLTEKVRARLARLAGDFELRTDRAWVAHELISEA